VIDAATHGMTSQKESSYDHLFRSPSPLFLFLGAHLHVASTHNINPVSDELVGLIILLFNYCTFLLCYYYIHMLKKKSFPASHGNIHTYIFIPVNKNMAHEK